MVSNTVLDLCSGIGGFSIGFEAAGFRTVAFSEIDPYCCAVLAKHWSNVPNIGDIRDVTRDRILGECGCLPAIVTAGFPCQPFSLIGKRRGERDERNLWGECARILCETTPEYALFENVPGLLTNNNGAMFNRILNDLTAIGYDCLWQIVPAAAVGAPHQRKRLWLLAHRNGKGLEGHTGNGAALYQQRRVAPQPNGSTRTARLRWPAGPGAPRDPWEPPQTVVTRRSQRGLGGVIDGVSLRLDPNRKARLRALGNTIVPQIAEAFAIAIRNNEATRCGAT